MNKNTNWKIKLVDRIVMAGLVVVLACSLLLAVDLIRYPDSTYFADQFSFLHYANAQLAGGWSGAEYQYTSWKTHSFYFGYEDFGAESRWETGILLRNPNLGCKFNVATWGTKLSYCGKMTSYQ